MCRRRKRNCVLTLERSVSPQLSLPRLRSSCKMCRVMNRGRQNAAIFARSVRGQSTEVRCEICDLGSRRDAASLANAVLFDFVLKGSETDAKKFGRPLPMIGHFDEGAPDRFTLDLFQW